MTGCRLSVIVPFYDETPFLAQALRSITAQGLTGVETIVVNDNPERFGPADLEALDLPPGVQILHHAQNSGLSVARNTGMAAARGARIAFLDADDYYLAGGLAAQLAESESSGADLTHANTCLAHVGSPALTLLDRDRLLFGQPRAGKGLAGVEQAQFITSSWASIYRRDFLDVHGLRFDPEQRKFEDRLFVLQTVTAAQSIRCTARAARVWRRRSGSISVTRPDASIHLLQVQLLEKCMATMRAHHAAGAPPRFLKREVFNTVSRLIWDMELLPALAAGDPGVAGLGPRVVAALGDDRFGQQIFDDPVLAQVSRVGMKTRKGKISRADFFALHDALRRGAFDEAAARLAAAAPRPPAAPAQIGARARRLVLHLGMHKTGSTWLQRQFLARRAGLEQAGILLPRTGLAPEQADTVRPGGFPGHQGLLTALREGDEPVFTRLGREIAQSRCGTVVISCENFLLPLAQDRDSLLPALLARLGGFDAVRLVAFVRRPDSGPEMLYREIVSNGIRGGARSLPEFLVDYGDRLLDLPGLFGAFEAFAGSPVALQDHDASARAGDHWARFCAAAGLDAAAAIPAPANPPTAYVTPGRDAIAAARLLNAMIPDADLRARSLRGFFAMDLPADTGGSALPPAARLALIDRFALLSADWAAARGYAPDLAALRAELAAESWHPPEALSQALLDRLQAARLQAEPTAEPEPARPALRLAARGPQGPELRLRLRPWALALLQRATALRR